MVYKVCIFRFGQVSWAVRESINLASSGLPYERREFVHQELSEKFTRARKVEEVHRKDISSDLTSPHPSANSRDK